MPTTPDAAFLRILPSTDPDTLCLALVGDLDHETGDDVLDEIREALRGCDGVRGLRLDCREVATADSAGLAVLLQLHRDTHEAGLGFRLDRTGPRLERLLRITGTYEYLTGASPAHLPADPEPAIETGDSGT
ncbi:STAS domain-containing protein [Streptomyces sp. NPDC003703]|uniref:STAS domain-containing protein n=1 Tax=Streptomyces sp. NPDC003283 TaxID=3364681 RepID=UPI003680D126